MIRLTGDEERIERIKANGHVCLARLLGDVTWEDWMGVGAVFEILTEEALSTTHTAEWDQKKNKKAVKEFDRLWNAYEAEAGTNHKPLSPQERWALRTVMSTPALRTYRDTLTGPEKRRLNHPNAVINRWKAMEKKKAIPDGDKPLSAQAKLKQANIALQEELHQMKTKVRDDHNGFTKDDSVAAVVDAVIGTFDGLPTKVSRVEAIARKMLEWVKEEKKKGPPPPKPPGKKKGKS